MKRELFRTPSPQLNELSKWLLAVGFSIACFSVIACIIGLISLEVSEYHMSIPSLFKGFMPSIEGAMFIIILIAIALFSISIYSYQTNKDKAAIVSNPSAPASSSVSSEYHSDTSHFTPSEDSSSVSSECHSDIPLFKYIHVAVTDDKERLQIHKMICNIVRLPKMQQICDELYKLMKDRKVLCTINPDSMLAELRRLGLPNEDTNGFSDKNFSHYYRAPKID